MSQIHESDITIIGASFGGMTLALALSTALPNLRIAIIEKQREAKRKADGRAYAISNHTLDLFKKVKIFDQLELHLGPIKNIEVTDAAAVLAFLSNEEADSGSGAMIESHILHDILTKNLLTKKNITTFFGDGCKSIDQENQAFALVETEGGIKIKSQLVAACDGRNSLVRKQLGIYTLTKDYQQNAIVFSINHENPHAQLAHEKFFTDEAIAILPMLEAYHSSIVWIAERSQSEILFSLDEENFLHQLSKRIGSVVGKMTNISEKFTYPLGLVEAAELYQRRVILVGDAACGIHPITGQGFNLAVSTIKILVELVEEYLASGVDLAGLTRIYSTRAKIANTKMVVATDLVNSIFESKNFVIMSARKIGISALNKIPPLKNFFIKSAGGGK